jgi:HEAT repeat protein
LRQRGEPTRRDVAVAGHTGDVDLVRRGFRASDAGVRATALTALARLGAITTDDLHLATDDPVPAVRRRAAAVIGARPPARDAAVMLRRLLDDDDDSVLEVACFATGEVAGEPHTGHEPSLPEPAVAQLVERLSSVAIDHPDSLCRESAVAALGSIGDEGGRAAVLAACDDRATIRRRAVLALAAFDGPDVDAMLERMSGDRDLQVRHAAEDLLAITRGHTPGE